MVNCGGAWWDFYEANCMRLFINYYSLGFTDRILEDEEDMEQEIMRKYVNDLPGLLKEIRSWYEDGTVIQETLSNVEQFMYETAVIFLFGRLYRFFNFEEIVFASRIGQPYLDAVAGWKGEQKYIEFEVKSSKFKEHIKTDQVRPEDYARTIIVCWEQDSGYSIPSGIEVVDLKHFWRMLNMT